MPLDSATVARIATLARIHVPDTDREPLAEELTGILDWIEQLAEVDTDDVEPMRSVMGIERPWREDKVTEEGRREDVLANAPATQDGCFVVPKVIE